MKYALNLGRDGRVLSVTFPQHAPTGALQVNELPEGDISQYRYVNGEFVHDPLPLLATTPKPTTEDRLSALEAAMLESLGVSVDG